MLKKIMLLSLIGLVVMLLGCNKQLTAPDQPVLATPSAEIYYTQFNLFQERGVFRTTNYRKGVPIPINTPATLLAMDSNQAMLKDQATLKLLETGEQLIIENTPKHTLDPMPVAFAKVVATSKVDLSQFTDTERAAILAGEVKPGMSKKSVIAAIGYPPQNKTPSLDDNDWRYWENRFGTFVVRFKNDKVEKVVD
jgi:hypothetical protein